MVKRIISILVILIASTVSFADTPIEGRAGRAEVRFLQGMIDHHQMALDMANHCLENASSDALKTLCQAVLEAQTPEIEQMVSWLSDWYLIDYEAVSMTGMLMEMNQMPMGGHQGMNHTGMGERASDPPMMMGMFAFLTRTEGLDYDIAWLEAMIEHHEGAIHMSERVLKVAEHADLVALAENIITAQTAEIEQMEALITELSS